VKENQPSATAQRVAMRSAAHQPLDDPKVFDDSLALRIISEEGASALQADLSRSEATPPSLYLRAFMAARSRYAEDQLALCVQRIVCAYFILGAGLAAIA